MRQQILPETRRCHKTVMLLSQNHSNATLAWGQIIMGMIQFC